MQTRSTPGAAAAVTPEPQAESLDAASPRLGHVPALDGLRGLAVIAVLVYHQGSNPAVGATFGWAHGGFLGVDLFFVLSGFLITTLLLVDHERRGRVISVEFWVRRARRLLPALFVFLMMIAAYSRLFAHPYELGRIRRGSLATLFYVANFWQLHDPLGSVKIPLGHTWSLAIEEQFYLLWPLVLALLLVLTRGRWRALTIVLAGLAIASAVLMAVRYSPGDPWGVYLSTQTRVFALLVGAFLAVVLRNRPAPVRRSTATALEAAGCIALAFLTFMVVTASFTDDWLYRGGLLVVAVASAVCIGASVQPTSGVLARMLSWRPLCAVGLVSYGLYLYHIPIYYVLGPEYIDLRGYWLFALRLVVVGAFAALSYRFIERPIRLNTWRLPNLGIVIPSAFAVVAAVLVVATAGETATPGTVIAAIAYHRQSATAPPNSVKVLVAGGPLAYSLAINTPNAFTGLGVRGATVALPGCALTPTPFILTSVVPQPSYCKEEDDSVRNAVDAFDPDLTVLMAGPTEIFDRQVGGRRLRFGTPEFERYLDGQLEHFRKLLKVDGAPLVLLTVPCMTPTAARVPPVQRAIEAEPARVQWLNDAWRRYADRHRGTVRIAEYGAFLCGPGARPHGASWRPDGVALGPAGAAATWNWLAPIASEVAGRRAGVQPTR